MADKAPLIKSTAAKPILETLGGLAPPVGRLVSAARSFGPEQRERLAQLYEPGLGASLEATLQAQRQDELSPILAAEGEEQQRRAQILAPAAGQGLFGAVARASQGGAQRVARAIEAPMSRLQEKRLQLERKKEEDIADLEEMKRERRQAVMRETFAVLGAAAKGGLAFEAWAGERRALEEGAQRALDAKRKKEAQTMNTRGEDGSVPTADQIRSGYDKALGDGAFERALGALDGMSAAGQTQGEMNAALQVLGVGNIPRGEAAGYAEFENPSWSEADIENAQRQMEAMRGLQVGR